jgi:hypothetical protein
MSSSNSNSSSSSSTPNSSTPDRTNVKNKRVDFGNTRAHTTTTATTTSSSSSSSNIFRPNAKEENEEAWALGLSRNMTAVVAVLVVGVALMVAARTAVSAAVATTFRLVRGVRPGAILTAQ